MQVYLSLGILGLLAYTLRGIDWRALWAERPVNPLFYLLFLIIQVPLRLLLLGALVLVCQSSQ